MSPGHSRANPSLRHLRVASIPTLLPHHGIGEAWSSVSAGPVTNSRSRRGSMLPSARHATSAGSWTFTSASTTTITFVNVACPSPQIPCITLRACCGTRLSIATIIRL